jgi:hypothetical protein
MSFRPRLPLIIYTLSTKSVSDNCPLVFMATFWFAELFCQVENKVLCTVSFAGTTPKNRLVKHHLWARIKSEFCTGERRSRNVMKIEQCRKAKALPMLRIFRGFVIFVAVGSTFCGLSMLFTAFGKEPALNQPDPLLGLSNQLVLLIGSLLCLTLTGYLFVGRTEANKGIALSWMGMNFLVYGFGLFWMQRRGPCPVVVLTAWQFGIWPATLNLIWEIFTGFLVIGGILVSVLERRRSKEPTAPVSAHAGQKG